MSLRPLGLPRTGYIPRSIILVLVEVLRYLRGLIGLFLSISSSKNYESLKRLKDLLLLESIVLFTDNRY